MKIQYPWRETPVGGWFFVPSLKPEETRTEGLLAAMHLRMEGSGDVGVLDGRLGVVFRRLY